MGAAGVNLDLSMLSFQVPTELSAAEAGAAVEIIAVTRKSVAPKFRILNFPFLMVEAVSRLFESAIR
jgi:hypothetical protein